MAAESPSDKKASPSDKKAPPSNTKASSSTKKAAKLAQKGQGQRIRFQGGTLFPIVVSVVLVLGLALIVYARVSRPAADASSPTIYTGQTGDHWHGAYGFQLCSAEPNVQLAGDLEERDSNGNLVSQPFSTTGIHSHNDGVIHWHAWYTRAAGQRAQLGIFFENYDVEISNDRLELPDGGADRLAALNFPGGAPEDPDAFPLVYEEGETQCGGEDAELKVVVWSDYTDPDSDTTYTSNFDEIPFNQDGLVVVIAFVPNDVDVTMPSWAANLPALGAVDAGNTTPDVGSTVPSTDESTSDGTDDPTGTNGTTDSTGATDTTEATDSTDVTETTESDSTTTEG